MKYKAFVDTGEVLAVDAPHIGDAVEEAIWTNADEGYVLAVYPENYSGPYRLVETRGLLTARDESYSTLSDALNEAVTHDPVSIAIPDRRG